jgi:cell division protein FtsZ
MKRRAFFRLPGALVLLGLPWVSHAEQLRIAEDSAVPPPVGSDHQWLNDDELWKGEAQSTVIKVVGVGGAGGNAVEHMIREGCRGIDYICCNTDALALTRSSAPVNLQFGSGLGAGGDPELARGIARLDRSRIAAALAGAHMVFITAGLGGGTGTGAAPVVAEVARELGILTVAVVTKPFEYEGKRRLIAEDGAIELARHVDALIAIPNEKLVEAFGDEVSMREAFMASDNLLKAAITGIVEMFNKPGLVGVDFEDVRSVIGERRGRAAVGSSTTSGIDRARRATETAMTFPLMDAFDIGRACSVLVSMTGSTSLGLRDYKEVMRTIRQSTAPEATVIAGAVFDDAMGDQLRVTVVVFGIPGRA